MIPLEQALGTCFASLTSITFSTFKRTNYMIARMTEAWIFTCGFLFLSFRGNAPLFRGIMTHERDRQVFGAGGVGEREGG